MKKLLLAAAATAAFSSAAIADNEFYLRADAGVNMFNKVYTDAKKAKVTPSMELGAGYALMDNVRAELAYGYHFNPGSKGTAPVLGAYKVKADIQTLMVKGFYDAFDLGMAQVFVGSGVGLAKVSQKFTYGTTSEKAKAKNNFTYLLALGTAFDVADSVKIDVQYNFQSFGQTKATANAAKATYRSHAIKAGVRFAL